jgi:hypothetical protein
MAGIQSVYYADFDNVETCLPGDGGVIVSLLARHRWSLIEADEAKASATYEDVLAWRHHVELLYHGNQQQVESILMEMTQRRFLVKVVDNNGTEWLYGHGCSPLRFRFESENSGEADGETAYRLTFEALCPEAERRILS